MKPKLIVMFTRARHRFSFWATSVLFTPSCHVAQIHVITLIASHTTHKWGLYVFLIPCILIIVGEENKWCSPALLHIASVGIKPTHRCRHYGLACQDTPWVRVQWVVLYKSITSMAELSPGIHNSKGSRTVQGKGISLHYIGREYWI